MMLPFVKPPDISNELWEDLCELLRYRALTVKLFDHLAESRSPGRHKRLTRALKRKWVSSTRLATNEAVFALGSRSSKYFGVHHRSGFPFGNDGLLQHIGIATFCAASGFQRLLPGEFQRLFPECHRSGLPAHSNCLDLKDPTQVSWTIVDRGAGAFRFYEKASKVVAKRLAIPGFRAMIDDKRFRIVVITATPEKSKQIQRHVTERPSLSAPVFAVVIPSLDQFFLKL